MLGGDRSVGVKREQDLDGGHRVATKRQGRKAGEVSVFILKVSPQYIPADRGIRVLPSICVKAISLGRHLVGLGTYLRSAAC